MRLIRSRCKVDVYAGRKLESEYRIEERGREKSEKIKKERGEMKKRRQFSPDPILT